MEQVLEDIYEQIVDGGREIVQQTDVYFAQFFASIRGRIMEVMSSRLFINVPVRHIRNGINCECRTHLLPSGANHTVLSDYVVRDWDDVNFILRFCKPKDPADTDAVLRIQAKVNEIRNKHEANEVSAIDELLANLF